MDDTAGKRILGAYNSAIAGDLDPLVGLFADDLEWRGVQRGHLWWRNAPS